MTSEDINRFMRAALLEGRKALPYCLPNPPVGCVIVSNGEIVSTGYTNAPGHDHAEAMAMKNLPSTTGPLTFFVTLEPCSFYGKTPSCALAITNYDVAHVYVGIIDPHPKNQGAGINILRKAGIPVTLGILEEEINRDLSPYLITE